MRWLLCIAAAAVAVSIGGPVCRGDEATPAPVEAANGAAADDTDIPSNNMGQGGGFARPDDRPADDLKPRAHTVAIVSALGDSIGYQTLNFGGIFAPGYSKSISLPGAKLDEAAVGIAIHALTAAVPGFGLKTVDVPHETLVAHGNSVRMSDGPLNMIRDDLKAWRESHDVDLIVVLMPGEGAVDRHDTGPYHRYFFGMGVSERDAVLFLRAVVLDGKTGEVLSDMKARAVARLGGNYPEAVFSHPTPESNAMLAAEMRNLLAGTIPGLLRNAGL